MHNERGRGYETLEEYRTIQHTLKRDWFLPPKWLRFLLITVLLLGIFFRFANLDQKVYQHDEAFTSMRISGYAKQDVQQGLFDGRLVTVADVQAYQHPTPEKTVVDAIRVMAQYPEHPPLYYLTTRFWAQTVGSSVTAIRGLAALISLFAFPCIYWLCLELFQSPLTGWMAIAVMAISPLHVLYAQEARQYSLTAVLTLLASAALLRALRVNTRWSWVGYGGALVLGFYSNLLFVLVVFGHGIYVLGTRNAHPGRPLRSYGVTAIAAFLTFTPWLVAIFTYAERLQRWAKAGTVRWPRLIGWWARNLNRTFFDFEPSLGSSDVVRLGDIFLFPIVALLVGYACYLLYRKTPKTTWLFVFSLIATSSLPLVLMDVLRGGRRSTAARYLIPAYLGVQLAVIFLLAFKNSAVGQSMRWRRGWQVITVLVLSGGILSCGISLPATAWWNKFVDYCNPPVAEMINQSPQPLVVSDTVIPGSVLSLSHLLEPKVRLQLVSDPQQFNLAPGFQDFFLYKPSKELRQHLEEQGHQFELRFKDYKCELWQSTRSP